MTTPIKTRIEAVRRGEAPEGYSESIAGILPNDWTSKPLSEISKVLCEQAGDGDYETLSISAGIGFVNQAEKFGKELSGKQYAKYTVLRRGDFAYNKGNSKRYPQGCTYMLREREEAAVPNVFECFRITEGHPEYYEQLFINGFMNRQLTKKINHGVRDDGLLNLTDDDFYSTILPIPPIVEQQKIAEILSTCDRVIELKRRLLEEKRRQKQWLMQKLLDPNSGVRLPGFEDRWASAQFGEIVTRSKSMVSATKCTEGTKCIELEHIEGGSGRLLGYCMAETQESNKCQFAAGDVLFGKLRPYLKKVAKAPFCGVCSSEIWVLRPCSDDISRDYLFYIAQCDRFMMVANTSSGTKMPRAEWSLVQNYVVELPSIAEQKAIAKVLATIGRENELLCAELEVWKQKKKALMQLLLTGLVRVNA